MNFLSRPARVAAFALIVSLLAGCASLPTPRSTDGNGTVPAHDGDYQQSFPQ